MLRLDKNSKNQTFLDIIDGGVRKEIKQQLVGGGVSRENLCKLTLVVGLLEEGVIVKKSFRADLGDLIDNKSFDNAWGFMSNLVNGV